MKPLKYFAFFLFLAGLPTHHISAAAAEIKQPAYPTINRLLTRYAHLIKDTWGVSEKVIEILKEIFSQPSPLNFLREKIKEKDVERGASFRSFLKTLLSKYYGQKNSIDLMPRDSLEVRREIYVSLTYVENVLDIALDLFFDNKLGKLPDGIVKEGIEKTSFMQIFNKADLPVLGKMATLISSVKIEECLITYMMMVVLAVHAESEEALFVCLAAEVSQIKDLIASVEEESELSSAVSLLRERAHFMKQFVNEREQNGTLLEYTKAVVASIKKLVQKSSEELAARGIKALKTVSED